MRSPIPLICFFLWCSWFVSCLFTVLVHTLIEGQLPPGHVLAWVMRSLVIVGLGLTLIAAVSEVGLG